MSILITDLGNLVFYYLMQFAGNVRLKILLFCISYQV